MANTLRQVAPLTDLARNIECLKIQGLRFPDLPLGGITEIFGRDSSGRTSAMHAILATATSGGGVCAVVDTRSAFDAASAGRAGVDLGKLLWVQCEQRLDRAMKCADLILHAGGFAAVVLDLCGVDAAELQRIPGSYWYRFQRTVENTSTVFAVLGEQPLARSCSARQVDLAQPQLCWRGQRPFHVLSRVKFEARLRKPVSSDIWPMETVAEE
jgi:hypothetical protein